MLNRRGAMAGAAALAAAPSLARAQVREISISRQPGILYMPSHVIERRRLVEKHAERLGLPGLTVKWLAFSGGGAQQDALLAGGVDIINTGTGQLLLLWDRTRGGVKGVVASSAAPLVLVTREDRVKSLADLQPGDKIAVPTVKTSTQSILLQMAASKMYGPDQFARFDPMTVQMGHPDAYVAMRNPSHEVRNHFAAPPFQFYALKNVPGARVVTDSTTIIGGPLSQAQFFTTTKFADANPRIIQALRAAAEEARDLIMSDTRTTVDIYREATSDRTPTDEIMEMLAQPGMMDYGLAPQGTMAFARHLNQIGTLRTLPASWKDYYLPIAHDLPGA